MVQAFAATFPERDEVDFVIVGSGSAGGIIAKELSTAGHTVVVSGARTSLAGCRFHT